MERKTDPFELGPETEKGYRLELLLWCSAGPSEEVMGVMTSADKVKSTKLW